MPSPMIIPKSARNTKKSRTAIATGNLPLVAVGDWPGVAGACVGVPNGVATGDGTGDAVGTGVRENRCGDGVGVGEGEYTTSGLGAGDGVDVAVGVGVKKMGKPIWSRHEA